MSQVCTPLPEHRVDPGAQAPAQAPETHACSAQAATGPQLADRSHVCTPLPEHCVAPGVQGPVHAPDTHEALHMTAVPHVPFWPQVSTPLPEHCVAPGTQTPVHAPRAHA